MSTGTSSKRRLQRAEERRYRHLLTASLLFAFLGGVASCGGAGTTDPPLPPPPPPPPVAPVAVGSIPAQVITAGQTATVDVSAFFSDPDGDDLTYAAESSDTAAVTVGLEGSSLTVTAVAAGTATVTVTATDPDGLSATQSANITVEAANQAPEAVGTIPAQTMTAGQTATVDVSAFFSDPDGDDLTYAAESSDTAAVTVGLEGSSLTVTAVAAGTATVTVTATDPDGLTATQGAEVTVEAANQAPEAVGAMSPVTMTAGQTATRDVSAFFSDPDGDELTYTAESSDAAVASVSMEGNSLTLAAVGAGTATVTVTATDPDGLTATQGAEVTVEAANQAPEAVGAIPPVTMKAGQTATGDVSAFFSDPDGDELTYTAESSNADVLTVGIEGSTLTLTAVAAGMATLTVRASDPDDLSATQSAEVTVAAGFRDDFDTAASLDNWAPYRAELEVVDGILHVTPSDEWGTAHYILETPMTEWTLGASMARNEASGSLGLSWVTGHDRFTFWRLAISTFDDGDNWILVVYDSQLGSAVLFSGFSGGSDAIGEGAKEFTDVAVSYRNRELAIVAGDTDLIRFESTGLEFEGVPLHDLLANVTQVWLGAQYVTTLFDWVEIRGDEVSVDMADRAGARGAVDLVKEALETYPGDPIRLEGLRGTHEDRRNR